MLRVGVVAGEASGDLLGAGLIRAVRARRPQVSFEGVAGPAMVAEGCRAWLPSESLAVMGLAEVLAHLPRLLRARRLILRRFLADPPDVFVGIDAPEFNLGLERRLRRAGIATAHYVSPQVWAWRQGRVRKIGAAVDLVLCLFPFEQRFYDEHGVAATFVGHPLADRIPLHSDRAAARAALGIEPAGPVVAVLPGSRRGEVRRLGADFAGAVHWMAERRAELGFVAPMANAAVREVFTGQLGEAGCESRVRVVDGQADEALAAADVVLLASGTATLHAMLVKRPMVVAYRLSPVSFWLFKALGLVKVEHIALPNLLAGQRLVPELVQRQVTPESLGSAVLEQLDDAPGRVELEQKFAGIHATLRRGADARAAESLLDLPGLRGEEEG